MMNENSFIYRFLCTSWVLITVVSRNSGNLDPESRSRLFSPPPHHGSCLEFFIARRFQLFLSQLPGR